MRFYPVLILFIAALAFGAGKAPNPSATPNSSPTPVVSASPSPLASDKKGITFQPVAYYTTANERIKIERVGKLVNQVIQSQCFADFMGTRHLIQTGGRTPAQVVSHIQSLSGVVPVQMYYRKRTSAVAYRQPPSPTIHLNRKAFWVEQSDCDWASTQAHEALHSFDYEHDFNWSPSRELSVPYSVNHAFTACCKESK